MCLIKQLTVVPGTSYTVTIGTGGATEVAGAATSFGALLTLAGGGTTTTASGGAGGGTRGNDGIFGPIGYGNYSTGAWGVFGGGTRGANAPANSGAGGSGGAQTTYVGRTGGSGCLIVEWVT